MQHQYEIHTQLLDYLKSQTLWKIINIKRNMSAIDCEGIFVRIEESKKNYYTSL